MRFNTQYYFLLFFMLGIGCLFLPSCQKDKLDFSQGRIEAQKNGSHWLSAAQVIAQDTNRCSFIGTTARYTGLITDDFRIKQLPKTVGTYAIGKSEVGIQDSLIEVIFNIIETDIDVATYALDTTQANQYIKVTAISEEDLVGEFSLVFQRQASLDRVLDIAPETIELKEGTFTIKIEE